MKTYMPEKVSMYQYIFIYCNNTYLNTVSIYLYIYWLICVSILYYFDVMLSKIRKVIRNSVDEKNMCRNSIYLKENNLSVQFQKTCLVDNHTSWNNT